MADKGKEKAGTGGHKRRALSVLGKHGITMHKTEAFKGVACGLHGAYFPDKKGEPAKSSTMPDALKEVSD